MKEYTKEDMKNFDHDDHGNLICPTGDYSQIHSFNECCSFGACCAFGDKCSFDEECSFGEQCTFGDGCSFREWCTFGYCCSFGACCNFNEECMFSVGCRFYKGCSFGAGCHFGARCIFMDDCIFDIACSFGEWCNFGLRCSFESGRVKNGKYFACDRIGSERRKTYFFRDSDGKMYVRAGCWFSTLDEFVERVKDIHGGTKYEKEYLAAVELAKIVLENSGVEDDT